MCECNPNSQDPMAVINAINNTNEESKRKELDDHKIFVIGAGLGRTGTGTLRTVLNNLGFKTNHCHAIMHNHHYNEWYYISLMTPALRAALGCWDHLYSNPVQYDAAVDFPTSVYFEEIYNYYKSKGQSPKIILTVRDNENEWYDSTKDTIYALYNVRRRFYWNYIQKMKKGNTFLSIQWNGLFNGRFENKSDAIAIYKKHNEYVQRTIPEKDLLVISFSKDTEKNYYKQIMDFLNIKDKNLREKYENEPLPQENKREIIQGLVIKHKKYADRFNAVCLCMTVIAAGLGVAGYNMLYSDKKK
eukprot:485309_1